MAPRIVLITGCSSGIGRAAARAFAQRGATVYATARRPDSLRDLTADKITPRALDVLDETSMAAVIEEIGEQHGAVDVLVNNAGYGLQAPIEEAALAEVRHQFETNVFGLVRLTQLVLPGMRHQGFGRIVNVSSMGGRFTFPGGGFYHATKHAVESLSDALRLEVAPFGIAVSLIEPGPVRTEFGVTAVGTINEGTAEEGGPYDAFKTQLAAMYAGVYDGRRRLLASSPERVAAVVVKAAEASQPRARYVVGLIAHALITSRRVLPDRAFDALVRANFPTP